MSYNQAFSDALRINATDKCVLTIFAVFCPLIDDFNVKTADYALMLHQQQGWQWQFDKSLRPRTENTTGQNPGHATSNTQD